MSGQSGAENREHSVTVVAAPPRIPVRGAEHCANGEWIDGAFYPEFAPRAQIRGGAASGDFLKMSISARRSAPAWT